MTSLLILTAKDKAGSLHHSSPSWASIKFSELTLDTGVSYTMPAAAEAWKGYAEHNSWQACAAAELGPLTGVLEPPCTPPAQPQ